MYEVELTEPQSKFLQIEDKFPLFVAGFGSGKSTAMCVSIFNDLEYVCEKPIKIGAYAPTYDLLKLITIPYLCGFMEEMGVGFSINRSDYIITLETDDQIILRSLANPERIVGYQTFRAHIDEIDTLREAKANEAWNKVVARNRQKVPKLTQDGGVILNQQDVVVNGKVVAEAGSPVLESNRISAYTTPEGFGFAYKRWQQDVKPGYVKVKASTYSNQKNLHPDYIQGLLDTYPAGLIEAYIEGEFVNLVGESVYPKFDRELNHSDEEVQKGDILEVGMDFNVVHGAAVIHVVRKGEHVAVDEIHDAYDTDEQIAILQQRYAGHPINIYPDATGTKRTSANTTETDIVKLKAAGFKVFADHANPPIKDRVMSYNAMICNGKNERRYKVNTKKCPHLTNALEQQTWDDNGLPDKSNGLDHIVDAGGYYVFYRFGITKTKATVRTSYNGY